MHKALQNVNTIVNKENGMVVPQKRKEELSYDSEISLLCTYQIKWNQYFP